MSQQHKDRQLDFKVAREVFGWEDEWRDRYNKGWTTLRLKTPEGDRYHLDEVPRYSSNISAAWEVLDKLKERWDVSLSRTHNIESIEGPTVWVCKIGNHVTMHPLWAGKGVTAPLAICRAALKVVGDEQNLREREPEGWVAEIRQDHGEPFFYQRVFKRDEAEKVAGPGGRLFPVYYGEPETIG